MGHLATLPSPTAFDIGCLGGLSSISGIAIIPQVRSGGCSEGGDNMKAYRRLVASIGSIVALLLAGGAWWKVG
jgi:hypothetical protein